MIFGICCVLSALLSEFLLRCCCTLLGLLSALSRFLRALLCLLRRERALLLTQCVQLIIHSPHLWVFDFTEAHADDPHGWCDENAPMLA
jgi:hypothetical protein